MVKLHLTWLNCTGAQHRKPETGVTPHSLTEWQPLGSALAVEVHPCGITCLFCRGCWYCKSTCWDFWTYTRGPVTAQRLNLWYSPSLFLIECCAHCSAGYFHIKRHQGKDWCKKLLNNQLLTYTNEPIYLLKDTSTFFGPKLFSKHTIYSPLPVILKLC